VVCGAAPDLVRTAHYKRHPPERRLLHARPNSIGSAPAGWAPAASLMAASGEDVRTASCDGGHDDCRGGVDFQRASARCSSQRSGQTRAFPRRFTGFKVALGGNQITIDGCRFDIDAACVSTRAKSHFASDNYERPEREAIQQFLDPTLPVVEFGGSMASFPASSTSGLPIRQNTLLWKPIHRLRRCFNAIVN